MQKGNELGTCIAVLKSLYQTKMENIINMIKTGIFFCDQLLYSSLKKNKKENIINIVKTVKSLQ